MPGRIAILTTGLWRHKDRVKVLSGLDPVFAGVPLLARNLAAVAGWGNRATAEPAKALARRHGVPYLGFEDGFLRSVRAGPREPAQSLVIDDAGIYYDATRPSRLEILLETGSPIEADKRAKARRLIELLRTWRLSKYNDADPAMEAPMAYSSRNRGDRVLVVDQTVGDASIAGGLAEAETFDAMLAAAIAENPGKQIIVKLHPEVMTGRKAGYLSDAASNQQVQVLAQPVNPWPLLEEIGRVYTVSSQLGLEALLAGCDVTCFGMPFYAGWGLTDDRQRLDRRTRKLTLDELVAVSYLDYCRYFCAWTGEEIEAIEALRQLKFRRDQFHRNAQPVIGYGITSWKRPLLRSLLYGKAGRPRFVRTPGRAMDLARQCSGAVAAWGRSAGRLRDRARAEDVDVITVEDGFLRSVGLGAGFTPPLSLVFDRRGIYYDPSRPSELDDLLLIADFDDDLLEQAERLRRQIVAMGLTKYNLEDGETLASLPADRELILVPGQVADDESIRLGARELFESESLADGGANLALLKAVRQRHRKAFIIYKPHPDVEADLRAGRIESHIASRYSNLTYHGGSIVPLLERVHRVETATSLSGFEALLRRVPVTTHGQPFYAGWGLTEDLRPVTRRGRNRTLDELVAACLIAYPRYHHPGSGTACPVSIAIKTVEHDLATRHDVANRMIRTLKYLFARSRLLLVNPFQTHE